MDHARTIAIANTLLADGRADDVVDMVEPVLDSVTTPAASTGQILLRGLLARAEIIHRNDVEKGFDHLPEVEEIAELCTCVRAEVSVWRGWGYARRSDQTDERAKAVRLLKEAQDLFASINDPLGQCWAILGRARAYFSLDEYGQMRRMLDDAAPIVERLNDTQAERWLHELSIPALRFKARYREAQDHLSALRSIADDWNDSRVQSSVAAHNAALRYDRGDSPSTVIEAAERATSRLLPGDRRSVFHVLTAVRAHVGALQRRGEWGEALEITADVETALSDIPLVSAYVQTLRAQAELQQGDADEAKTRLDDVLDDLPGGPHGLCRGHFLLIYGQVLAEKEQWEEAITWLRRAHRRARETGHRGTQLRALLAGARVAARQNELDGAYQRIEAASAYEECLEVVPHAYRWFFVNGRVAYLDDDHSTARSFYKLARRAASFMRDQPAVRSIDEIIAVDDDDDRSTTRQPLASKTRETTKTETNRLGPRCAGGDLRRAARSLSVATEIGFDEFAPLLSESQWMGVGQLSKEGNVTIISERGRRPSSGLNSPVESEVNGDVEWITISQSSSGPSFFLGLQSLDSTPSLDEIATQKEPWFSAWMLSLERAVQVQASAHVHSTDPCSTVPGFLAKSDEMRAVADEIQRMRPSHSPVLLTGERGTGKGFVSRVIHETSVRADGPFERISCDPTQQEEPIDRKLFGTGPTAEVSASGTVDAANGGTLVIEDVEALPLSVQSTLLQLLATGITSNDATARRRPLDVRIIATTTADLDARVDEGRFLRGLRDRLGVLSLHVPPLRERRADIPLLIRHFIEQLLPESIRDPSSVSVTQPAREALLRYGWPGNVRQLRNEIERALLYVQSEPAPTIDLNTLLDEVVESAQYGRSHDPSDDYPDAILHPDQTLNDVLSRTEKAVIERVLQACDGQITASADVLGLTRQGLYKKMKRLDIDASTFQSTNEPAPAS